MSTQQSLYTNERLSEAKQVELLSQHDEEGSFESHYTRHHGDSLRARSIDTLQVNVGRVCNQQCLHCHVDAGPHRTEQMERPVFEACLEAVDSHDIKTVDITGGAPEMNPHFRWFVREARARGVHVIDRCNLTITQTRKHADLIDFFAEQHVEVVASLPHFRARNTDRQRGDGVYEKSIRALKELNAVGYGKGDPGRRLVLVTNPVGMWLPPDQDAIRDDWKRQLKRLHDVTFDDLFCITNMPVSRFLEWLLDRDRLDEYLDTLRNAFTAGAAENVMCRDLVSVRWDGALHDCDFNQMLDLPTDAEAPQTIFDFNGDALARRRVLTASHCFGCSAGSGSSCGGNTR